LYEHLSNHKLLTRLQRYVHGFVDTLKLVKLKYKEEYREGVLINHKLGTVVRHTLGETYCFDAHNAEADVLALKDMTEKIKPKKEELTQCSFTLESYETRCKRNDVGCSLDILAQTCSLNITELRKLVRQDYTLESLENLAIEKGKAAFIQNVLKSIKMPLKKKNEDISQDIKCENMYSYVTGELSLSQVPSDTAPIIETLDTTDVAACIQAEGSETLNNGKYILNNNNSGNSPTSYYFCFRFYSP
jgi:hypothetical protein